MVRANRQAALIIICNCLFPRVPEAVPLKKGKCPAGDSLHSQQSRQTKQRTKQNTHHGNRMVFIV